ncbi:NAD-dependent epimerase/dehydratase family protein [Candidatus Kaiserbacteria bacterium]|nr:NAD-dependent epimerase/dehydratase family protein [Candidatus Kaiserbacteria bacterium]
MPGKTILVTGGAGFVGSALCKRLIGDGHRVISLDNYFTGSKDNHVAGVEYREGHTKDIEKHITETPDIIFHLGEYSRVEKSFSEPALVWDLNKDGTFGVLEFWRKKNGHPVRNSPPKPSGRASAGVVSNGIKLVYAGSSTKFGDGGMGRDQSPYAWTKASNTELVRNYGNWFGLAYAITYFYNVYGPGERAGEYGTLIEIFKQKYVKGEPLGVVSPGTQKRNFTYIDDIVEGLMLVGEKGEGDDFGLGDTREYSVLEVAKLFGSPIEMLPERPGNRMSSPVDVAKATKLGWSVQHSVEDYIRDITS